MSILEGSIIFLLLVGNTDWIATLSLSLIRLSVPLPAFNIAEEMKAMRKWWLLGIGAALLLTHGFAVASVKAPPKEMSTETKACVKCHKKNNPGLIQAWGASKHYGANVGCYECHAADAKDPDAYIHDDKKVKKHISIIVSPKDCANCHEAEAAEMKKSHHADAGKIMGSLDNLLAEVIEGDSGFITEGFPEGNSAAAVNGCWQCHGSQVKVLKDGQLDPATWPNTGIGRINPDGSKGSCAACHSRHQFSAAQARQPENCGKCHMGPDHPQIEIYNESKHGIAYRADREKMNMDNAKWVVGEDYYVAPTCATCHMSATRKQGITHDVGDRLSWNNRPPVSKKQGWVKGTVGWEDRRDKMKDVCNACHEESWTENWYTQYDGLVDLYNRKYGEPGLKLMKAAKPLIKGPKFSNKIDFIWFELWHHEGRRARMAASMQGPDITHWEGTYDLGKNFYTELVPELKELIEHGKHGSAADKKAAENLAKVLDEVLNMEEHKWFLGKMDPAKAKARKARQEEFKNRYKEH
ncbi:multiheme c-type cytochrome [endosymbiont of Tevnia jerichonana]|uniref:multiheme c-type cytochrome n=1 Tax=endosymbiont of Tevnia jerichonana TaxID=94785 RepID=UPI001F11A79E|nr:multiheme c-type cytochrome [endosymbiont of Tevnia jerichonana]